MLATTEPVVLMQEAHGTIEFLPELKTLIYRPVGNFTEELFKADHLFLLRIATQHGARRLLVNETDLKSIPTSARIWMTLKFMRMPETKAFAATKPEAIIVKAKSVFAASITRLMHQVITRVTGVGMKYFATEEEAMTHLERAHRIAA